jgi:hypothetical protein
MTWANGVAYGQNGREYRVSHNSETGLWEVPLGKTLVSKVSSQQAAQQMAEDWETAQLVEDRMNKKAGE